MKSKIKFFTLFFLFISSMTHAVITTHITKQEGTPTDTTYYYTIESWDEDDKTPNPCYNKSACDLVIGHTHFSDGTGKLDKIFDVEARKFSTIGELGKEVKKEINLPYTSSLKHSGEMVINECVGILYQGESSGFRLLPGNNCEAPPPLPLDCRFQFDGPGTNIDMEFPPTPAGETIDKHKEMYVKIYCNEDGSIALQAESLDQDRIVLRNAGRDPLYAFIYINDKDAFTYQSMELKKGINTFKFSAHLMSRTRPDHQVYIGYGTMVLYYE